jgi:hypothetical protein
MTQVPKNWAARDRKLDKRRNKEHVVESRSVFVIKAAKEKRDRDTIKEAKREQP